jgi:hypothetical protein
VIRRKGDEHCAPAALQCGVAVPAFNTVRDEWYPWN